MTPPSPRPTAAVDQVDADLIVVGAGGAGMCAALAAAARHGLDTVVIESSETFGGSTARSGGGVWIPGNYALREAGQVDPGDAEQARTYLDAIVGNPADEARRHTYLERGPEVMAFLRDHIRTRFRWVPDYADYLPEQPGGRLAGRSVEPVAMDARFLGPELDRLTAPYTKAPTNVVVTQADFRKISLGMRTWRGPVTMARVMLAKVVNSARGRRMYAMGNAIAIGLRQGLIDYGVRVDYGTALAELLVEDGRVTGVVVERDGVRYPLRSRHGVILATGGFEHSKSLRQQHLPAPTDQAWSTGAASNTGAGHVAGRAIGAATDLMNEAWWGPTIPLPGRPWFCLAERNLPGSIMVNGAGVRFMNEALPYVEATHEIYRGHTTGISHVPAYLIFDQTYRNRYLFAGIAGRQALPKRWYNEGVVSRASTIPGLAGRIGVPADALAATVARFNEFARRGVDADFHRGESGYDKYYSDPTVKPNCSLAPLEKGPFYAVHIVPGDLGTKGGLVTDEHARVLDRDGKVIEGLYAAGNASASIMGRTYPGPGGTIGPALVFGYLAAEDVVRRARAGSDSVNASETN